MSINALSTDSFHICLSIYLTSQVQDGQKSTDLLQEQISNLQKDLTTTGELLNEKLSALDQLQTDYSLTTEQYLESREKLEASESALVESQNINSSLRLQVWK